MTGIAITLAAREDGEAIDRIEKLIGHKIPRAGGGAKEEKPAEKPAPAKAVKEEKPVAAKAAKPKAAVPKKPEPMRESSPVVEDIKSDWNGPLPAFLSFSAD
jgi:superfamily II DNA/RNA helicase